MIIDKEVEPETTRKSAGVKSLEIQQAMEEEYKGLRIKQGLNLNLVGDDIRIGRKEDTEAIHKFSFCPKRAIGLLEILVNFPRLKLFLKEGLEHTLLNR